MKSKILEWAARIIPVLMLAGSIGALAQDSTHARFSGVINAYSPQTTTGPYEIRGPWSLKLKGRSGKADFSAALNMVLSDGWVVTKNMGNFDPNARGAHTHHVVLVDGDVTPVTGGFQVSGTATVTLNGSSAPVSPTPLVIVVTGGTDVAFSNVALTFGTPGSHHFGTEPLPGVVRSVKK
jgi:hypothetical protein